MNEAVGPHGEGDPATRVRHRPQRLPTALPAWLALLCAPALPARRPCLRGRWCPSPPVMLSRVGGHARPLSGPVPLAGRPPIRTRVGPAGWTRPSHIQGTLNQRLARTNLQSTHRPASHQGQASHRCRRGPGRTAQVVQLHDRPRGGALPEPPGASGPTRNLVSAGANRCVTRGQPSRLFLPSRIRVEAGCNSSHTFVPEQRSFAPEVALAVGRPGRRHPSLAAPPPPSPYVRRVRPRGAKVR